MIHPVIRRYQAVHDTYHEVSFVAQEMGRRLWDHVAWCQKAPQWVLDLGAGSRSMVQDHYPDAILMAIDAAASMAKQHGARGVCADAHHLPLTLQCMDLVVANSVWHWLDDPKQCLQEVLRVLKPEGVFFFSTFGPDTLKEARSIWTTLGRPHAINTFRDLHEWGDDLRAMGYRDPVLDRQLLTVTFASPMAMLRYLKRSGSIALQGHQGLLTPRKLQEFCAAYQAHQASDGTFEATFEIVIGQGWGIQPKRMIFKPSMSVASVQSDDGTVV